VALAIVDSGRQALGRQVPCNAVGGFLFNASTIVAIENGSKAKFWQHSWLNSEAPRNLATHLFHLVRRKNKTVQQELTNGTCVRTLRGKITTVTQTEEFILLWPFRVPFTTG
jgi:predicted amidophosphoribosyltransferase